MSALFPEIRRFLPLCALPILAASAFGLSASDARGADVGCTRICAQIIQAIGDDIKEQIPLDCVQQTGTCTGSGYFQTAGNVKYTTAANNTVARTLTTTVSDGTLSACCSANSRSPRSRSSGSPPPNGKPKPPLSMTER